MLMPEELSMNSGVVIERQPESMSYTRSAKLQFPPTAEAQRSHGVELPALASFPSAWMRAMRFTTCPL